MKGLDAGRVRALLSYDANTGVFTWAVGFRGAFAGTVAGSLTSNGYVRITIDDRSYMAHRLAWLHVFGVWPAQELDHINQVKTDNRIANLREVTRSENQQNRKIQKNNKSGYRGVSWEAGRGRWRAQIALEGKLRIIGRYRSEEEAYAAYCKAAEEMHTHRPQPGCRGCGGRARGLGGEVVGLTAKEWLK
ncbi:HNH endonuclease [Acidovorax kalamii]|uniref:HNH endonuclease n=1 Tax=Acidovorax kalamii TaxID=2004485 RepID=UPI002090E1AB|nr:HNH endonuclease [Acidovorax kalamii]